MNSTTKETQQLSGSEPSAAVNVTGVEHTVNSTGLLDFAALLDVPVTLSVEVGGANLTIDDLTRIKVGNIIELDRLTSEPVDVLINGTKLARGVVVVSGDNFAIRLVDIVKPPERFKSAE